MATPASFPPRPWSDRRIVASRTLSTRGHPSNPASPPSASDSVARPGNDDQDADSHAGREGPELPNGEPPAVTPHREIAQPPQLPNRRCTHPPIPLPQMVAQRLWVGREAECSRLLYRPAVHQGKERQHSVVAEPHRHSGQGLAYIGRQAVPDHLTAVQAESARANQYAAKGGGLAGHREELECERPSGDSQRQDVAVPVMGHLDPGNAVDALVRKRSEAFFQGAPLHRAVESIVT